MSGSGLLPRMPAGMAERIAYGVCDFAEGEALGETVGRRAERCDMIAYFHRKRANALAVAKRCPEEADHAISTARAMSVAIDDLRGGLHEGEALVGEHPTGCAREYPFRDHRTMAEVEASTSEAIGQRQVV